MDGYGSSSSRVKMNRPRRVITSGEKLIIVNYYKSKLFEGSVLKFNDLMKLISKSLGIGVKHVHSTISEYRSQKGLTSPSLKRNPKDICNKVDDFEKNAIRRKVHQFWLIKEMPSINKILISVNEDNSLPNFKRESLRILLKSLSFKFCRRNKNSILTEQPELISWRRDYLRAIKKYREEGRTIYYVDETWLNTGDCSSKGKMLIILHIGSENGFVPGGLLCFEAKKNTHNYRDEISNKRFQDWFEEVLPFLENDAVIVMDSAPYHSVKCENVPTYAWKKQEIVDWLISKGEDVDPSKLVKVDLMNIVLRLKPSFNSYIIDEIAKKYGKTVLRVPPYHCELNPIKLVWSMVKGYVTDNNTTFKTEDMKHLLYEGLDKVKMADWVSFINHVKKEETKFWEIDFIFDDLTDNLGSNVITIEDTSSELSDDDCDDDDDDDANF